MNFLIWKTKQIRMSISTHVETILRLFQSGWEMTSQVWKSQPYYFTGLIFFEFLQGLIPLGGAWFTKLLFDLLAQSVQLDIHRVWHQLVFIFLGLGIISILQHIFQSASSFLSSELNRQLTINSQLRVNEKINSIVGLAPFEDPKFYSTIQQAIRGAQTGPQQTVSIISVFFRSITVLLSFNGLLVSFDPFLTGLVWLVAVPQLFNQLKFGHQRFNLILATSQKERQAAYYNEVLSTLEFAKDVRLFGLADYFLRAFRETYQEVLNAQRNQQLYELRWQLILNLATSFINIGVFVIVILRAITGAIGLGSVTLYTSAVNNVQSALAGIIFSISALHENALSFSKYKELLALPQSLSIVDSPRTIPISSLGIEVRNMSFRYSNQSPWVLRNVNLSIPIGQSLALVGLNGAGKTTFVKLLTRLYDPVEGQILWGGVDIREFDPKEWRSHIAAIFQDFSCFEITAFENIALGDLTQLSNISRIFQAAKQAGIHDEIKRLPQGYQTILSRSLAENSKGTDLSGGEWQKIALARMFVRQAELLILDEPTASLDAQAEYNIHKQFLELMARKTCILISHRFSTVRMSNRIAVLKDGTVVEQGTHKDLIKLRGTYERLYNLQAEQYR